MRIQADINEILDTLYQSSEMAFWYINNKGEVSWDEHLYSLYNMSHGDGLTPEDFKGRVHSEDWHLFNDGIKKAINGKKPLDVMARVIIQNRFQWVRISGLPDNRGGILGTTQNVDKILKRLNDQDQVLAMIKAFAEANDVGAIRQTLKNIDHA